MDPQHPLRFIFYMQAFISIVIIGLSSYLLISEPSDSNKFNIAIAGLFSIGGYWFPSPKVSKKSLPNTTLENNENELNNIT